MTTEQAPRELTDAQIQEIAHKDEFWFAHLPNAFCYTPFARAVIAADRALVAEQAPREFTDDDWLDLASRHANADWNSDQPDGFLNSVKSLCGDFRALVASQAQPAAEPALTFEQWWDQDDERKRFCPSSVARTAWDAARQQPAEPRQDSVHSVESGGTTLPLGSEPGATAARDRELLAWAYSKLIYRSFDSMEDALAMDEIKLILMGAQ